MFTRRLFAVLAIATVLLVVLLGRPFAAHSDNTLFSPLTRRASIDLNAVNRINDASRTRAVDVNWSALSPQTEALVLNLFDDVTLNARLRRVDTTINGGFVWVGDVEDEAGSSVTLSVKDGILAGSIYRGGLEWGAIRYAGEASAGAHLVIELDPHAPQPAGRDYIIPRPSADEIASIDAPREDVCVEDGSEIGLMVAYSPAARDVAGGREAIEAHINKQISDMNSANDASAARFDWRLVHMMEVDYQEADSLSIDLQNLQRVDDGVLDEVHAARDTYKADLVALLVAEGNHNACGYAFQMSASESWFQAYSFAVVALDYPGHFSCSSMTLAHELGHNLGNAHDRDHAAGPILFPYSYGYQSPTAKFRDIMSYDCPNGCPRINQWANPEVWYEGEPTGIDYEVDPANAADIVASMDGVRVLVSNFRADCRVDVSATPTEDVPPTDSPGLTDTPEPTETPLPTTSSPISTPTTAPHPSPTSEGNATTPQFLFLPAVVRN